MERLKKKKPPRNEPQWIAFEGIEGPPVANREHSGRGTSTPPTPLHTQGVTSRLRVCQLGRTDPPRALTQFPCGHRGAEAVQPGAAGRGDHRTELHPRRGPRHLLQDVDQSGHGDGPLYWPSHRPRARGHLQEQQSHVGGRLGGGVGGLGSELAALASRCSRLPPHPCRSLRLGPFAAGSLGFSPNTLPNVVVRKKIRPSFLWPTLGNTTVVGPTSHRGQVRPKEATSLA